MASHTVIMGDITGSTKLPGDDVMQAFQELVQQSQDRYRDAILSPLTITLGDEFQGVAASRKAAVSLTRWLERERMRKRLAFSLRFAVVHGEIDTELRHDTAHGMLGPALTKARSYLSDKSRNRTNFALETGICGLDPVANGLCTSLWSLSARWRKSDYALVADLLSDRPIKEISAIHKRKTTTIYRRRKTLQTQTYASLYESLIALMTYADARDKSV